MKNVKILLMVGVGVLLMLRIKNISSGGFDKIIAFEEYKQYPYQDSAGICTVGYGHRILSGEDFSAGLTKAQAYSLAVKDLAPVEAAVNKYVTVPINQNQFDALCSFTFNVGIEAFINSTLLKELNAGNYQNAANQFTQWDHIHKDGQLIVDQGLLARRQKEAATFLA